MRRKGFTLIELMIVIAIIAVISAIAIPSLMSARGSANEAAAQSNLKAINSAQLTFRSNINTDLDSDGSGEFSWFESLAGTQTDNQFYGDPAADTADGKADEYRKDPVLAANWGKVGAAGAADVGLVTKSGFYYALYLMDSATTSTNVHMTYANATAAAAAVTDGREQKFFCAAWPVSYGSTGKKAFFVNQQGTVYFTTYKFTSTTTQVTPSTTYTGDDKAILEGTIDTATTYKWVVK